MCVCDLLILDVLNINVDEIACSEILLYSENMSGHENLWTKNRRIQAGVGL